VPVWSESQWSAYSKTQHNFEDLKTKTLFKLLAIHADTTKPEEGIYDARDGHVVQLQPNCNMVRGRKRKRLPDTSMAISICSNTTNPKSSSFE
jgi:hypothetical protein